MIKRNSTAAWQGDLKAGQGTISLGSGAWSGPYNFSGRFESGSGTNPEELIGAAHAGCFSMALSGALGEAGFVASNISTKATVNLEMLEGGPTVTGIVLDCEADVPNISAAQFNEIATATKSACPISRLLASTPITLNAQLVGSANS